MYVAIVIINKFILQIVDNIIIYRNKHLKYGSCLLWYRKMKKKHLPWSGVLSKFYTHLLQVKRVIQFKIIKHIACIKVSMQICFSTFSPDLCLNNKVYIFVVCVLFSF